VRGLKLECLEGHYELAGVLVKQGDTVETREVLDRLLLFWTDAAARELRQRLD